MLLLTPLMKTLRLALLVVSATMSLSLPDGNRTEQWIQPIVPLARRKAILPRLQLTLTLPGRRQLVMVVTLFGAYAG